MALYADYKDRFTNVDLRKFRSFLSTIKLTERIEGKVGIFTKRIAGYMHEQEYGHYSKKLKAFIPPRPWLRYSLANTKKQIKNTLVEGIIDRFERGGGRRLTIRSIKDVVSHSAGILEKEIKMNIEEKAFKPLHPMTIKAKKEKKFPYKKNRDYPYPKTPLYATGDAFKSIKVKITMRNVRS